MDARLGWLWLDLICSSQISVCPCTGSACADPAETGESVGRSSARSCAPGAPSADVTDLVQPRGAPGAGHARGNAQLRSCPPTCKTQTQKPGQTSQWTWIFLLMDILEGRVCSSSSAPGGSRAGHRSHPSITARRSSPQFVLHNTWLMREHQSLECWPFPCQFWHFSHQSTRNKSHLSPCWFTGITKPPCAGGSRPAGTPRVQ